MAAYIACQRGNITAVVCISQLLDRLEAVECVQVFKYSSRTNTYLVSKDCKYFKGKTTADILHLRDLKEEIKREIG